MSIVEYLLSDHDDEELDCQLQQAAIGGTLIHPQTTNTVVIARITGQAVRKKKKREREEEEGGVSKRSEYIVLKTYFPLKKAM